jgi:molecular chaperone HtpG
MADSRMIPFEVKIGRVVELLATQIYQSPLALLRENAQNAFDAVLIRAAKEADFVGRIDIAVTNDEITVTDNGVGMTPDDLVANYWTGGSSGKNTPEARAAGVVGTFGIGAMANFGIADFLTVETESSLTPIRTRSYVERARLSTTKDCIALDNIAPTGNPGTAVTAHLESGAWIDIDEAVSYIGQFVEFVAVPVFINGQLTSGRDIRDALPSERGAWKEVRRGLDLDGLATADLETIGLADGSMRVLIDNLLLMPDGARPGRAALTQATSALRTLRSGFGLATVSVPSTYSWGGVLDLPALQPTAGREALESTSNDLIRRLFSAIDSAVSAMAAGHRESLENQEFLGWIHRHERYELCEPMTVRVEPGSRELRLGDLVKSTKSPKFYAGSDAEIIRAYSSEDDPLVVVSRRSPRRDCELGYLRQTGVMEVGDQPQVVEKVSVSGLSIGHGAVAVRVARILAEDYFVEASVEYAKMTHGVPLLVDPRGSVPALYMDPDATGLAPLLELYEHDFASFGPFVKDFIRAQVFPKLSNLVPSSTREGAEAFLRRLRDKRELFEIDWSDREDLQALIEQLALGEVDLATVVQRSLSSGQRSVVIVRESESADIASVVPGFEDAPADPSEDEFGPLPPIDRRETSSQALLLSGARPLNGYTCFLAISERAHKQYGEFFLQPHTTAIVWGGQKVIFVFEHHSRQFGLYYDVQCPGLVDVTSGGQPYRTSTILLKDRVFIPVPPPIADTFTPREGERIRLEVRCDVLYLDHPSPGA